MAGWKPPAIWRPRLPTIPAARSQFSPVRSSPAPPPLSLKAWFNPTGRQVWPEAREEETDVATLSLKSHLHIFGWQNDSFLHTYINFTVVHSLLTNGSHCSVIGRQTQLKDVSRISKCGRLVLLLEAGVRMQTLDQIVIGNVELWFSEWDSHRVYRHLSNVVVFPVWFLWSRVPQSSGPKALCSNWLPPDGDGDFRMKGNTCIKKHQYKQCEHNQTATSNPHFCLLSKVLLLFFGWSGFQLVLHCQPNQISKIHNALFLPWPIAHPI